jgi:hypothetical protein
MVHRQRGRAQGETARCCCCRGAVAADDAVLGQMSQQHFLGVTMLPKHEGGVCESMAGNQHCAVPCLCQAAAGSTAAAAAVQQEHPASLVQEPLTLRVI